MARSSETKRIIKYLNLEAIIIMETNTMIPIPIKHLLQGGKVNMSHEAMEIPTPRREKRISLRIFGNQKRSTKIYKSRIKEH